MVNVFRDHTSYGQLGPRGPPGRSGSKGDQGPNGDSGRSGIVDVSMDTGSDIGTIPARELIKTADEYVTWNSRSALKMNAIQNPSKKVLHISKTHSALVFIESLYEVDDVVLSPSDVK